MLPRVLIVDDEPNVTQTLKRMLEATRQYEAVTTNQARQALKLAQQISPDVILLDVMMPDINGLDLLKKIKQHRRLNEIPVIMLTAMEDDSFIEQAMRNYAERYLVKPVDLKTLQEALEHALQWRRHDYGSRQEDLPDLTHLAPGIQQIAEAFMQNKPGMLGGKLPQEAMLLLQRWWRSEELGMSILSGDIWSPLGVLGQGTFLKQAEHAKISRNTKVLDLACGLGGTARILARNFHCQVYAVDPSEDNLLAANALTELEGLTGRLSFHRVHCKALPFPEESFDVVWGHGGWGTEQTLRDTWCEALRVTKHGGTISSPGPAALLPWLATKSTAELHYDCSYGRIYRHALEHFIDGMLIHKNRLIEQAGETVWNRYFSRRKEQLEQLDENAVGILTITKI